MLCGEFKGSRKWVLKTVLRARNRVGYVDTPNVEANCVPSTVLDVPAGFKASIEGDSLLLISDNWTKYENQLVDGHSVGYDNW